MSEKLKQKNIFCKIQFQGKVLLLVCALVTSFLVSSEKSQAALWPGIDPPIAMSLTKIYDLIQGAMLGAAKQAAAVAINKQIDTMLSTGSKGGPMFITNWDDYLATQPKKDADIFINSYIADASQGKGSLSSYMPASSSLVASANYEGVGDNSFAYGTLLNKAAASVTTTGSSSGSYASDLTQAALAATSGQKKPQITYEGDPAQMFADGTTKKMLSFLSGVNYPTMFVANAQNVYKQKIQDNKDVAKTMAVSYQGFKGVGTKNAISNPGSLVKDMKAGYQNMNVNTISNARSLSEVITGAVSSATAKAISMGIGSVSNTNQKSTNTTSQVSSQLNANSSTSQFFKFVNR